MPRHAIAALLAAWVLSVPTLLPAAEPPATRPNILVILADDLGYGELGCYGGRDAPTPSLDAMARAGVRCTAGYVTCPVCSPSRAGLLTGKYPQRFGHENNIGQSWEIEHAELMGLPAGEKTLADRLRAAGYRTACIGKWHLGVHDSFQPQARGFDDFFGFLEGGRAYLSDDDPANFYLRPTPPFPQVFFKQNGRAPIYRGHEAVSEPQYLTDAFTREALRFIDAGDARPAQPFFLYLAYNAVHTPITPCARWDAKLGQVQNPVRRAIASMTAAMDEDVGRLRAHLRERGLEHNTLVIFLSDNGGSPGGNKGDAQAGATSYSLNTPLRGFKGECWEGGIRIPYLIEWPGRIPAGVTNSQTVSSLDILPTALAAAGAPPADPTDGVDLLPFLTGGKDGSPHEQLFWRFHVFKAVRDGGLKLVKQRDAPDELYDLANDLTESRNLAAAQPDAVARLNRELDAWEAQMIPPRWNQVFPLRPDGRPLFPAQAPSSPLPPGEGQGVRATAPEDKQRAKVATAKVVAADEGQGVRARETYLPKSPPPARILAVVDFQNLRPDERIALTCLQGLTARTQPTIFVVRHAWDREWLEWHKTLGHVDGYEDVADWTELLRRWPRAYRGAVVPDENLYRGDLLAANVAACEDLIVAPRPLAVKLGLPVKIDLRGRFSTYVDGLRWLWSTYRDRFHPHLCDFRQPELLRHGTFDYSFEFRAPMFWIAGKKDGERPGADAAAEKAAVAEILAAMPPGGVCVGFPAGGEQVGIGEVHGVELLSRYGHALVCNNHISNCSLLSGFRVDSLSPPSPPPAPALDRDKLYIALVLSDGDNQILWPEFFKRYFTHPAFGTFPLAFGLGPAIRELQPGVAQWYFQHATPTTEFVCDVSGAGYMQPEKFGTACADREAVLTDFLGWTKRLMAPLGLRTIRTVGGSDEFIARYAAALPECHSIFADMGRYSGRSGIANLTYSLPNGMPVFRAATSWRYGKEGFWREVGEQVGDVRPAFVNGFVHCWTFTMDDLARIHAARPADAVFVTPSQLAALYQKRPQHE